MLEEERKFDVEPGFILPDLTPALPPGGRVVSNPAVTLRATYYDTADLRLARSGASLRYRRGDPEPWTAKLPTAVPGIRIEICRPAPPGEPPDELVALVTRYTRGAPVRPSIVLTSRRVVHELRDGKDRLLAEVDDDTVTVLEGTRARQRFREIEVERHTGPAKLLQSVGKLLVRQGARAPQSFTAKHVRALGDLPPADLAGGRGGAGAAGRGGRGGRGAARATSAAIFDHDPLVRLRIPLPDGDTAVHQMRVGCRRLRSDLKTFRPVLDRRWADRLRAELGWLADALGVARDAEVLRDRLRHTAAADPVAPLDADAVARIDAELAPALRGRDGRAGAPADRAALPRAAGRAGGGGSAAPAGRDGGPGGAAAGWPASRGASWPTVPAGHRAPRACARTHPTSSGTRYASAPSGPATPSTRWRCCPAVRRRRWRRRWGGYRTCSASTRTPRWPPRPGWQIAAAEPADHALAVTAGRLAERERAAVRRVRAAFPARWADTCTAELTGWLR